jgi:hypothetical protein
MREYFFTMSRSQLVQHFPERKHLLGGYVKIRADTKFEAEQEMFKLYGRKWAFSYYALDDIHPLDRVCLAEHVA